MGRDVITRPFGRRLRCSHVGFHDVTPGSSPHGVVAKWASHGDPRTAPGTEVIQGSRMKERDPSPRVMAPSDSTSRVAADLARVVIPGRPVGRVTGVRLGCINRAVPHVRPAAGGLHAKAHAAVALRPNDDTETDFVSLRPTMQAELGTRGGQPWGATIEPRWSASSTR
jgi:hypothetical protein